MNKSEREPKTRRLNEKGKLVNKTRENEISRCIITTCSNIQVMRIKEVITKDKMS